MKTRLRIPTMLVIPACLFLAACQSPSGQPLSAYDFRHDWISAGELHSLENAHQISILLRKGREIAIFPVPMRVEPFEKIKLDTRR